MSTLLEIEPRHAGTEVVEPDVEFAEQWENLPVDCLVSSPTQTVPVTTLPCCH
jgi:hypothetical protein